MDSKTLPLRTVQIRRCATPVPPSGIVPRLLTLHPTTLATVALPAVRVAVVAAAELAGKVRHSSSSSSPLRRLLFVVSFSSSLLRRRRRRLFVRT